MRVLVTGGAGYIGSHTVRELLADGFEVVILDNLSRSRFPEPLRQVPFVAADIADGAAVRQTVERYGVEAVIHFAGLIVAPESMAAPLDYYRSNVAGGIAFLAALRAAGVDRLVFSSSAGVYGQPERVPIPETTPPAPLSVYGETKAWFETILAHCGRAYGLHSISLRYFNAAGAHPAGDLGEAHRPESHLIPLIFRVACGLSDAVPVAGDDWPTRDGTPIRDYIHVVDLARAHVAALRSLLQRPRVDVYNVGTGAGFTVREVVRACREATGHPLPERVVPRRPGDPAELVADVTSLKTDLGWQPALSDLPTIVRTAWAWHRDRPDTLLG